MARWECEVCGSDGRVAADAIAEQLSCPHSALKKLGWTMIRVWEHESAEVAVQEISQCLEDA